jgi:hypothetical protein
MSDWKVFYRDNYHRDARSTHASKEAAIAHALHLERCQHCRIQIIEGQNGELIDRETFEREHKATHATKSSVGREESFAKLCGHQFRGVRREY